MASCARFGPSELDRLSQVFDDAWLTLLLFDGTEWMDRQAMRNLIAKRIFSAAIAGETDLVKLKQYALKDALVPETALHAA